MIRPSPRAMVGFAVGLSLLACIGSPPPPGEDTDVEAPPTGGDGPWTDAPSSPREPGKGARRRPAGGGGDRDGDRDRNGDGRGKQGKRPHREPPPDTRPEPDPRRQPAPSPTPAPDVRGIEFVGDDTWKVDRSKLDGWVSDPDRLGAVATKKSSGYELSGVRSGSDAEALGGKNGDLVKQVNGKSLTSTTDLLLLLGELDSAKSFRVELVRGGQSRVHHYQIQ